MKKKIFYFSTLFITILCLFICIALNDDIYNFNVENVVKIRTGEEGYDALQDVEQF